MRDAFVEFDTSKEGSITLEEFKTVRHTAFVATVRQKPAAQSGEEWSRAPPSLVSRNYNSSAEPALAPPGFAIAPP